MFHLFGHPVGPSIILEHIEDRRLSTQQLQCNVCYVEKLGFFWPYIYDDVIFIKKGRQ